MHDATLSVRAGQHAARADHRGRQRGGERVAVDGGHRGHAQGAHARLRRGAHQRQLRHHGRPLHGAIQDSDSNNGLNSQIGPFMCSACIYRCKFKVNVSIRI